MPTIPLEEVVAKKFRLEQAPTLLAQREAGLPIAFTRLRAEGPFRGTTLATPPEEAFTFQVALASMPAGDIWIDRRHRQLPGASPGETFVFDLASYPVANLRPPFDFLRFYLPVRTLDQLAYEHGLGRVGGLRTTSVGVPDTIMHGLALAMSSALQNPGASNALFLDAVALAFQAHVIRAYGSRREIGGSAPAGLAPWQLRRVDAFIDAHLDGDPTTAELARECRLSASHFARAFARSTGVPPHRWLTKRRVQRAKELLLAGELPVAEIALACGFFDQSHLNRVFARYEGCPPAKWRRLRK